MVKTFSRICFFLSGLLAVLASIYIAVAPLTVTSITAQDGLEGTSVNETTLQVSWFAVQGWWGMVVLALFAVLYLGNAWLAITRRYRVFTITALVVLVLTYLAGFSIGGFYIPAAILLLLGTALLLLGRP
jgi:hypothetical protein